MKMLIVALVIIILISIFCTVYSIYLNSLTESMLEKLEKIQIYVSKNELKTAKETFSSLKKQWEKNEVFIQLETEHNELDIINEQFAVLSSHFDIDEYDEFFETLYKLVYFTKHITEKKQLNLKTIL